MQKLVEQAETEPVTTLGIMCHPCFRRGVEDVRAGRPFDHRTADRDGSWFYERGRQFGFIAPPTMPLIIKGRPNPKALALLNAAFARNLVI